MNPHARTIFVSAPRALVSGRKAAAGRHTGPKRTRRTRRLAECQAADWMTRPAAPAPSPRPATTRKEHSDA
jgi:hypothetical protein